MGRKMLVILDYSVFWTWGSFSGWVLLWEIWVLEPGWGPVLPHGDSVSIGKLSLA